MILAHRLSLTLARWYWRIFKPKTYGVKVIIQHPITNEIVFVRHSYGNQAFWHLPGGGYRPRRESAESAAHREVLEELGIKISNLLVLGEYKTTAEGKRDTVTIFLSRATDSIITSNSEIKDYQWIKPDKFASMASIYKVSKYAIHLLMQKEAD